ncbi:quinon protein alcohol dehydrogenase-like superfamily [Phyllosticta citrichinensis]|uniref:Quinon protein alcohol dehydrogenase-like superfamily n=1 Tax=Phyllosticta citrichinensis TaxID=1130410 RepID=A0ABR1XVH4_9PEZI
MSNATTLQSGPATPQDAKRKRKAKDSTAGKHGAKRIRTQGEDVAANGTPAQAKQEEGAVVPKTELVASQTEETSEEKKPMQSAQVNGEVAKPKKKRYDENGRWYASEPVGGRFLQIDPVFSKDEKYIIFATSKAVLIYSVATSLLVRTLPMNQGPPVAAYALSSAHADRLWVSDAAGFTVLWDWVNGKKLARWDLSSRVRGIATTAYDEENGTIADTLFVCERGEYSTITAHRLRRPKDGKNSEATPLLRTRKPITGFNVAAEGNAIVASFKDTFMVGKAKENAAATLKDLTFVWRELRSKSPITSMAIKVGRQSSSQKPRKPAGNFKDPIDVVIGCHDGSILVYDDVVNKLIQLENAKKENPASPPLAPRRLHWHRYAVSTVKWSLEGDYIISGGQETVLVMWQTETGKSNFLPHLTAAIDAITVSPSGASYAVQLADNSVIALSTTELEPKAHVAGLQSQVLSKETGASGADSGKEKLDEVYRTPAAINPQNSNQILLAVPVSQPKTETNETHLPAPFLQVYDISSNYHVSRQAITRNNATIFMNGPDATRLREPDVRHLQLSSNGQWLATVEEWVPPHEDVEHLAADKRMTEDERNARREVYLKFWMWNDDKKLWVLETRIDAPHQFTERMGSGRVFDLKFDPNSTTFATVGEDGFVRIWTPKTRLRDGTVVRGSTGQGFVTWSNRHSVKLESSVESLDANSESSGALKPIYARIAYSPDGSVLAASQEFYGTHSQGLVHFIDPASGIIRYSRAGLYSNGLVDIGFSGSRFIILSNSLSLWNLVDDELSYGYSFLPLQLSRAQKAEMAHLAINHSDGTFAVSLPPAEDPRKKQQAAKTDGKTTDRKKPDVQSRQSKVVVFDPSSPRPIYSVNIPRVVTSLIPAQGSKGYVALNTDAEVRVIAPRSAMGLQLVGAVAQADEALTTFHQEETMIEAPKEEDEDEEMDDVAAPLPTAEDIEDYEDEEGDKPVVRSEKLAQVFDVGPSFALPPVRDLFDAVVQLYSRKPKAVGAAA